MKKKYQITLVIIGCLVVLIGLSYAYYMVNSNTVGNTGSTTVKTVTIEDVGFNIEGLLEFNDLNIYPGHKNISKIKVTAIGNNDTINYKLVWEGINTLNTPIKYYVYKTSTNEEASITCQKEIEQIGTTKKYYETCINNNIDNIGTIINEGEITNTNDKKEFILTENEVIKGTKEGSVIYYYVVLEYPNLEESQNIDMGGKFEGIVTVKKEEDMLADITIKKMYKEIENGYEEITKMPEEGYIINEEKSTCTNNATPILKNNKILVTNLNTSGTECNIYFDIKEPTGSETILNNITVNNGIPDFSEVAESDEGVYKAEDGMYGGYSYYWRGAVTNNYVKFGGFCWRIVRINGDGSLRLIYDGAICHENGTSTTESLVATEQAYNFNDNYSEYVGYTYTIGSQRTLSGTASNLKTQNDVWYNSNIGNYSTYSSKIADGKYCNDRNISSYYNNWASQPSITFYHTGYDRSGAIVTTNAVPTLSCSSEDVYTLKVGAITMDEVIMAGAKWATVNNSYYLYNGNYYWTMTPAGWSGGNANVFRVHSNGNHDWNYARSTYGVRPVINLKDDVTFSAGNGTLDNPYIVS